MTGSSCKMNKTSLRLEMIVIFFHWTVAMKCQLIVISHTNPPKLICTENIKMLTHFLDPDLRLQTQFMVEVHN